MRPELRMPAMRRLRHELGGTVASPQLDPCVAASMRHRTAVHGATVVVVVEEMGVVGVGAVVDDTAPIVVPPCWQPSPRCCYIATDVPGLPASHDDHEAHARVEARPAAMVEGREWREGGNHDSATRSGR